MKLSQLRQNFSVNNNTRLGYGINKPAVRNSIFSADGVDFYVPKIPEIPLFGPAVAVSISPGMAQSVLCQPVFRFPAPFISFCQSDDFLFSGALLHASFHSSHIFLAVFILNNADCHVFPGFHRTALFSFFVAGFFGIQMALVRQTMQQFPVLSYSESFGD